MNRHPYKIFAQVSEEVKQKILTHYLTAFVLSNLQRKVLCYLVYLALLHHYNHGGIFCMPSEQHLAKRFGVSRYAISRCLKELKKMGLLTFYQQIYKSNTGEVQWGTNLYEFGKKLWGIISTIVQRFLLFFNRVQKKANIVYEGTKRYIKGSVFAFKMSKISGTMEVDQKFKQRLDELKEKNNL